MLLGDLPRRRVRCAAVLSGIFAVACTQRHLASTVVTVEPGTADVQTGGTLLFSATGDGPVAWSLAEGAAGGAISADGKYTAPTAAGRYHVVATRLGGRASAEVRVAPGPPVVALAPAQARLDSGGQLQFSASASGADPRVTWSVAEGGRGGNVDPAGLYQAPELPGTYHLVATSVADPARSARAEIEVAQKVLRVAISPLSATLGHGASLRFSAVVAGAVVWSSDCGTMGTDGTFLAPGQDALCNVVARSATDPARFASAAVTVTRPTGIDPAQVTLLAAGQVQFHGSGAFNLLVGGAGGSVTPAGLYRAPADAGGTFYLASGNAVATITVLPPDLIDHGGPVAAVTRTFAVFWGDPAAFPPDLRDLQEHLLRSLDGSDYLALADEYLRGAVAITQFGGSFSDPSAPPISPGKADAQTIGAEACKALRAGGVTPAEGDWVIVYGGSQMKPSPAYCAWHSYYACGGVMLLVAFVPSVSSSYGCLNLGAMSGCNTASSAANATASLTAHELLESITDPFLTTWTDDSGSELGDKCEAEPRCVDLGTGSFVLQAEYSNAAHDCAP